MSNQQLLSDLLQLKPNAVEALDRMKEQHPNRARNFIWSALRRIDGRDNMSVCPMLLRKLAEIMRPDGLEAAILTRWEKLRERARTNICYGFHEEKADLFSNEFAAMLFEHPASSVHERHLIVAGLARTAPKRRSTSLVLQLLDKIGQYPDTRKQQTLDAFVKNVRGAYSARKGDQQGPTR